MDPTRQHQIHLVAQLIAFAQELGLTLAVGTTLPDPPPQPKEHAPQAEPPARSPVPEDRADVERAAVDAADAKPRTVKALAKRAGYAYTGHFRDAVRRMVDAGELRRVSRGVVRAAA